MKNCKEKIASFIEKEEEEMYKLKNKKIKKERGITLIALVITIIVLLILAGISIATLSRTKWLANTSK